MEWRNERWMDGKERIHTESPREVREGPRRSLSGLRLPTP
jgi:hypothetical protein